MERLIVEGGHTLSGVLRPAGNKNAALPMVAASLLTDEPIVLENVPEIGDIRVMLSLLQQLGVEVEQGDHQVRLQAREVQPRALDQDLCRRVRTSLLLAGPLLARCGEAQVGLPGGDTIGRRRNDTHLLALQALGATVEVADTEYRFHAAGLHGAEIFLDEASVTGTEQALLAACTAAGVTIVHPVRVSHSIAVAKRDEEGRMSEVETQEPPAPVVTEAPVEVAENVHVIPDGRVPLVPNIGIVAGSRAALVVDTGMGPANGATVRARVRCGKRAIGYVWLHDAIAYLQSRIFFRLF